ncbi:MAG: Maf family nucleotide pyrophosphatase [Actinobacteria bacterium]|nr:Maf family nucleotide pyrophosphatase [Actinomycetota bacterium]MCA1719649.1 Maf family nucleotide pyrophosphatase [Actinomycetota bacterium]
MTRPLVLASASPARLRLLTDAGLAPEVVVSGFDEDSVSSPDPADLVQLLAVRKAQTVAAQRPEAVVIGCDSMLLFDGAVLGKAPSPDEVIRRWQAFRGREGELLTGHCVIVGDEQVSAVGRTTVRFGSPDDGEIEAYARTDEAVSVAGPFTIDGRAAAFVQGIDGDAGNVIGLSLPLLRDLLGRVGLRVTDLWR